MRQRAHHQHADDKIMSMFVLFSRLFWPFGKFGFFSKMGRNLTPQQSNIIFYSIFERYNKVTTFYKSPLILTKKNEDKPNSR